jgi:hypothetical protein
MTVNPKPLTPESQVFRRHAPVGVAVHAGIERVQGDARVGRVQLGWQLLGLRPALRGEPKLLGQLRLQGILGGAPPDPHPAPNQATPLSNPVHVNGSRPLLYFPYEVDL